MTLIGHIAAGAVISKVAPPAVSFGLGVASHAVMDYTLQEYRGWPLLKHWPWWVWQCICSIILLYHFGLSWALLGAVVPDIIDGVYSLINPQAWHRGDLLCPWHRAGAEIWKRDMSWASTFAVEALLMWWALR